ncbi:MAG TPA: cupredoxin domain-containing protein [Solirubrobacteraceae bacterium]
MSRPVAAPALVIGVLALAAVSLALADRGGPAAVSTPYNSISVTLSEYSITPQTISVPGGTVRILVHNSGLLAHNLTIEYEHPNSNGEPTVIASTKTVLPGKTASVSSQALSAGRYRMLSTISNEADLGMTGTLIVR